MPVYFIHSDQIQEGKIEIQGDLAHHLRDVLRCQAGELLYLADETSKQYRACVVCPSSVGLTLSIVDEAFPDTQQFPLVRLGMGLLKGEKFDWVLQKGTELGVAEIVPLITQRTIPQIRPERLPHQIKRWRKIVLEAVQQSGRLSIPIVSPPSDFSTFLKRAEGLKLIFREGREVQPLRTVIQSAEACSGGITILIGPEGGWEGQEVSEAVVAGFQPVSLGKTILKADTAALVALAIVQYELK